MKTEKYIKKIKKYLEKIPEEERIMVIKYLEHDLGYLTKEQLNHYVRGVNILEENQTT